MHVESDLHLKLSFLFVSDQSSCIPVPRGALGASGHVSLVTPLGMA